MLFVVGALITSSLVMGNLAFRSGLNVKRWALLGLISGPLCYPLLLTHKRFALKRAQGKGAVVIRL
ncbi:hypothetical protein LZP69_10240 [Shewanella sp. AS1]|nr:hypothetical protein [Shewanella sp. AS1]